MGIFSLFGSIKRQIRTTHLDEEITTIFSNIKLDFTHAPLEVGDHIISIVSLFSAVKLRFADDVGVEISGFTPFCDVEIEDLRSGAEEKPGASYLSPNFASATTRIHLKLRSVFCNVDLMRVPVPTARHVDPPTRLAQPQRLPEPAPQALVYPYESDTQRLEAKS